MTKPYVQATDADRAALTEMMERLGIGMLVHTVALLEAEQAGVGHTGNRPHPTDTTRCDGEHCPACFAYKGRINNVRHLQDACDKLVYAWVEQEDDA